MKLKLYRLMTPNTQFLLDARYAVSSLKLIFFILVGSAYCYLSIANLNGEAGGDKKPLKNGHSPKNKRAKKKKKEVKDEKPEQKPPPPPSSSIVTDVFQGGIITCVKCLSCHKVSFSLFSRSSP